eukprot:6176219-Pleurochrysis_carterae.AAC.1
MHADTRTGVHALTDVRDPLRNVHAGRPPSTQPRVCPGARRGVRGVPPCAKARRRRAACPCSSGYVHTGTLPDTNRPAQWPTYSPVRPLVHLPTQIDAGRPA